MLDDQIKALIVDDNPHFAKLMAQTLKSKNCLVKTVTEPKTALALLLNEVFHVVFIDCILQSGQGTDLIPEIRNILGHSVEIIMMSGVVTGKSLSNYVDVGICDFLSKPISDKELESNLEKLRNKIKYGESKNILTKLFTKEISNLEKIKFLVSLSAAKDYEFFLYINSLLESGESFKLEFLVNNKKHIIFCNKGVIIDYESEDADLFLNKLLSKNFITSAEVYQLKGNDHRTCVRNLLRNCILSSIQIIEVKHDLLFEVLKEISPGMDISFSINLDSSKRDSFDLLDRNEYADLVFFFLKQRFNNQLFSLFDEKVMDKTLIFEGDVKDFLPEVEAFLLDLQSGMKLKGIYNKYINDKNAFCTYLLYILLKGNIYFSESSSNVKYYHLYQRYENLLNFIEKANSPNEVFSYFCYEDSISNDDASAFGLKKRIWKSFHDKNPLLNIGSDIAKQIYFNFVKYNHPDKFSFDLPKDLLDIIDKILLKMKHFYDIISNPEIRSKEEKKEKQKAIEEEMVFTEKKKIFERYIENKSYEKALLLLKTIPKNVLDAEQEWKLLYLWLNYENEKDVKMEKAVEYLKDIQKIGIELKDNKYYHQVLGLHYEKKQNFGKAKMCFLRAKLLDPSFQSAYAGINRCSIGVLKEKQKNQPVILKMMRFLKEAKEKNKKTG